MNAQANQPYTQDPVSKLASWDYAIGNIERRQAKTALDQHYAAGGLHPMEYDTRMIAIMGATMWSHLVAIFADLPAPGPAYDGKQLLKACQTAQKAEDPSPSAMAVSITIFSFIFFSLMLVPGALESMLVMPVLIFALCIVISMASSNKYQRVYQDFSSRLNLQQRALLDEASEEYAKYYWSQQQGLYQQQLFQQQLQLQQQQQIQNMLNNINKQY